MCNAIALVILAIIVGANVASATGIPKSVGAFFAVIIVIAVGVVNIAMKGTKDHEK